MASDTPQFGGPAEGDETPSARLIRRGYDWVAMHWRALFGVAFIAVLVVAMVSGFYRVDVGETASKRRFGQLVSADIKPGLHWRIPFGVDRVNVFRTEQVYRVEIDGQIDPAMSTFTGDFNLIDARFVVQYRVTDLGHFLFASEEPIDILSRTIRSAFVSTVSSLFVDMVLATEKEHVEETILDFSQQEIDRLGVGLQLVSVNLVFVQPPVDAIAAFRAVNDAKAQKQEVIDAAVSRRNQTLAQARGVAADIVEDAQAQAQARIDGAKSAGAQFAALLDAKEQQPDQATLTHYWNSVRRVLGKARIVVLQPGEAPRIGVNLLEGSGSPPGLRGGKSGKGGSRTGTAALPAREPPHPGAAAGHASEEMRDRAPGYGAHQTESEPHHFGPVPDNSRRLPPHRLDPNVKNPQPPQPSHLGLPHNDPPPAGQKKKSD